jgi:polysaccharide biosynthesis/export protein
MPGAVLSSMPLRPLTIFALSLIAGCYFASAAEQPPVPAPIPADQDVETGARYLLQPGDVLQVTVWKETDLTAEVLVRPDGGLSFALAGDMQAAGHTVVELTGMLEKRIRKFEPDAVVTVVVKAAAGNRVYVIGKVTHPGDFPLIRPIDVMQALSLAGGATPFADTDGIRILRRDGERLSSITFHYSDVERGRRLEQNILLQSGDTVVVP